MSTESKHLVVVISGHGFGHAAMTAPLIYALQQSCPNLRITIRAKLPEQFLRSVMPFRFEHYQESTDFGMVMHDAFNVDLKKSLARYQQLHQHWQDNITAEVERLTQLQTDYLISNIAYLPLAAAKQMGIPAIAFGCLNWAEIFQYYFNDQQQIHTQIFDAYARADVTIRTQPAMPMAGLESKTVGPVACIGTNRRALLLDRLALADNSRLVLASMGGIKTEMNIEKWPVIDGVHYIIDAQTPAGRQDFSSLSDIDISFIDILCSADLFLTKPGYGSFSQAACNKTAVLYVERPDWPEQRYLCDWLNLYTPCNSITRQQLNNGQFSSELSSLLQQSPASILPAMGLDSAVNILLNTFKSTSD